MYGSAILIRDDLRVEKISVRTLGTVELLTIVMPGVVVHSVYKPPNDQFQLPALGHRNPGACPGIRKRGGPKSESLFFFFFFCFSIFQGGAQLRNKLRK